MEKQRRSARLALLPRRAGCYCFSRTVALVFASALAFFVASPNVINVNKIFRGILSDRAPRPRRART